jgi:glycosyltransferase involved in cell wall biosynthesis
MKISIFTPTHDPKYIHEVYDSIKDQDFDEWVILPNGKINNGQSMGRQGPFFDLFDKKHHFEVVDHRIRFVNYEGAQESNIGALKAFACQHCTGDILVELDHDDLLTPDAIAEIRKAFEDETVGFVYSNDLVIGMDGKRQPRYLPEHGWRYRKTKFNGRLIDEPIAFKATPASISRIWYAPDHVRAFRKEVYDKVGGYDASLEVLDDQDLMCRLYQATKFHHIDKALYVYRVHGDNTWLNKNQKIQEGVWPLYDKHIEPMALKWADVNGYLKLDLGGRLNTQTGYKSVDLKNADINCDLNGEWPFEDDSVGVIRAFDVFEHLRDPLHTMKELYRVLAPGGYAFIQVPSTDGRGAFQDPTHVSFWNENSFLYYVIEQWADYIDSDVRFQAIRVYTTTKNNLEVCWAVAHLVKVTEGLPGIISI